MIERDGFRTVAIRVVDIQIGVVPGLALKVDVILRIGHVQIEIARALSPCKHDAHAIQILHHRTQRIGQSSAWAPGGQIGITSLLDDQKHLAVIRHIGWNLRSALCITLDTNRLGAVPLKNDSRAGYLLGVDG
ncbi:hypothetical protein [Caballeronia sp. AZ7_KS35]|uniref:hypothetical protein n=1 Tax=Caballeronia sp. AZ7_KS35 TaxID=2921762 RepID=UPI0020295A27|nr:hypothetical protein [Caballeronia sp. AZ7_KS35]